MPTLFQFQKHIQRFLTDAKIELSGKPHKILLVDVGLGKTPITADTIRELGLETALIVCPVKVKLTWAAQLVTWGAFKPEEIHVVWKTADKIPQSAKCVIVNYDLIRSTRKVKGADKRVKNSLFKQLYARSWEVMVLDEAQVLRNLSSKITFTMLNRNGFPLIGRAYHKWCLSATLHDKHIHLYPLAKSLAPELLGEYDTLEKFGERYCTPYRDDYGKWKYEGNRNAKELATRLSPLIYALKQEDAYHDMPPVIEEEIVIPNLANLVLSIKSNYAAAVYKSVGLAKAAFVSEWISDLLESTNESVLVCAHHRDVIEFIENELKEFGVSVVYGGISKGQFEERKKKFLDRTNRVFLINESACGVGVDQLQHVTNRVIFAENDWTDIMRTQVIGRVKRIGQTKPIIVTNFKGVQTYDVSVLRKQESKTTAVEKFINTLKGIKQMSIDKFLSNVEGYLSDMTVSLRTIAAAMGGASASTGADTKEADKKADKKADKEPEKKADKEADKKADKKAAKEAPAETTEEDVRKAAAALIAKMMGAGYDKNEANERCKTLNAMHGADDKRLIASVPKENYAALLKSYEAAPVSPKKVEAEPEQEDEV